MTDLDPQGFPVIAATLTPPERRSKHQTLKSVMGGQSKGQIATMFVERDHDAMEWVSKGAIKRDTLRGVARIYGKKCNKISAGDAGRASQRGCWR